MDPGRESGVRLGLGETERTAPFLPETPLLEGFDTFKTLQNAPFGTDGFGPFEAGMLGHDKKWVFGMRKKARDGERGN